MMGRNLFVLTLIALLAGCAGATPLQAPQQLPLRVLAGSNHCKQTERYLSVSVVGDRRQLAEDWPALAESLGEARFGENGALVVALGEKPTPGYSLRVPASGRLADGQLEVEIVQSRPPPGRILAQVITHPCFLVGWSGARPQSVRVFEPETGQAWVLPL